jgi:hypothetical protein
MELLDENQIYKYNEILNNNPNLSTDFVVKDINHLYHNNTQCITIYLDFFEIPEKEKPFKLAYQ